MLITARRRWECGFVQVSVKHWHELERIQIHLRGGRKCRGWSEGWKLERTCRPFLYRIQRCGANFGACIPNSRKKKPKHFQQCISSLAWYANPSCPNAPAEFFHQDISPSGIKPEPNRNTLLFFSFLVQSAAWRYLCKGAVCNVSGKRTLRHQSQSGPFISFALHVCRSDFDPVCVCVSLGSCACFFACILLRDKKYEGGSMCGGGVVVVYSVEQPHHGPGCTSSATVF